MSYSLRIKGASKKKNDMSMSVMIPSICKWLCVVYHKHFFTCFTYFGDKRASANAKFASFMVEFLEQRKGSCTPLIACSGPV
jgi:hypothetical protein